MLSNSMPRHALQPLANLQPGRAGFAVNKDFVSWSLIVRQSPAPCKQSRASLVRCSMIQF
jgi:hypothetical protein